MAIHVDVCFDAFRRLGANVIIPIIEGTDEAKASRAKPAVMPPPTPRMTIC